jgi:hypothetical protein
LLPAPAIADDDAKNRSNLTAALHGSFSLTPY